MEYRYAHSASLAPETKFYERDLQPKLTTRGGYN
jgi:hypothetical protein